MNLWPHVASIFLQKPGRTRATVWPRLVLAGVILILGLGVAIVVQKVVLRLLGHATPGIRLFADRLTYISVVIGVIPGALAASGVHIAAMATLTGTLGLAVSLSLQTVEEVKNVDKFGANYAAYMGTTKMFIPFFF